jgi:hypothetical protein
MSLVQGHSRRRHLATLGVFAAAFAASSFLLFALTGTPGVAVGHLLAAQAKTAIAGAVLAAALVLDAYSMVRKTWCPVTVRRQTPKKILLQLGGRRAALAWGLDTGLVVTTYRMSSICWALLVLEVLGVAPWWVGLGYATGFLLPLLLGCSVLRLRTDPNDATGLARALAKRQYLARTSCVAVLAVVVCLAGAALVP